MKSTNAMASNTVILTCNGQSDYRADSENQFYLVVIVPTVSLMARQLSPRQLRRVVLEIALRSSRRYIGSLLTLEDPYFMFESPSESRRVWTCSNRSANR
jgi:hypothetical protein